MIWDQIFPFYYNYIPTNISLHLLDLQSKSKLMIWNQIFLFCYNFECFEMEFLKELDTTGSNNIDLNKKNETDPRKNVKFMKRKLTRHVWVTNLHFSYCENNNEDSVTSYTLYITCTLFVVIDTCLFYQIICNNISYILHIEQHILKPGKKKGNIYHSRLSLNVILFYLS